jgi:hypothetical protein
MYIWQFFKQLAKEDLSSVGFSIRHGRKFFKKAHFLAPLHFQSVFFFLASHR